MITKRNVAAGVLFSLEGGLAAFGVLLHYDLTEIYGNPDRPAVEEWARSFGESGVSGIALVLVLVLVMPAFLAATTRVGRVLALATPVVMVLAMLAVTPLALEHKREWSGGDAGPTGNRLVAACVGTPGGGAAV